MCLHIFVPFEMAMKTLSKQVQENLSASTYISSYKRAVEELVYNALDADSTSVAVRINIEENSIQVIDNGVGIDKTDFVLLSQRYATSKCMDLSTLKSAPNKYGFRGLSLASLVEVSEKIKITSRRQGTEETWLKFFKNGKQCHLSETTQRPSNGTTVEIKGFLYNLNLRKKTLDNLSELNRIKAFLEQLSLVHSYVSLSLRNDSTNEIVFKVHKNRDTYQTIKTLFGIDKQILQEFKVEKNEYKVTAFISKNSEDTKHYHWIYLNGKFVRNTKLHKIVKDNFSKATKHNQNMRKRQKKNLEEENVSSKYMIPTYFIFLTCPNYDFDISYTPCQKTLEFKNWEYVTKIIEKLAKFYSGDINIKPVNVKFCDSKVNNSDTRDQVKRIIQKILGNGPKKPAVSQMKKCVKGKLVKRKHNSNKTEGKNKKIHISLSKVLPPKHSSFSIEICSQPEKRVEDKVERPEFNVFDIGKSPLPCSPPKNLRNCITVPDTLIPEMEKSTKHINVKSKNPSYKTKHHQISHKKEKTKSKKNSSMADCQNRKSPLPWNPPDYLPLNRITVPEKEVSTNHINVRSKNSNHKTKHHQNSHKKDKTKFKHFSKITKKREPKLDRLAQRFEASPTESTKKRCYYLDKKVDKLLKLKEKPKCEIFVKGNIEYSNIIKNNKSVSIRKKVDEIVIHNYDRSSNVCSFDNRVWGRRESSVPAAVNAKNLLHTVLNTQNEPEMKIKDVYKNTEKYIPSEIYSPAYKYHSRFNPSLNTSTEFENFQSYHKLTYQSHHYDSNMTLNSNYRHDRNSYTPRKSMAKKERFITTASRDNFLMPQETHKFRKLQKRSAFKNKIPNERRPFRTSNTHNYQSSITIEFSTSKCKEKYENSESHKNCLDYNFTLTNHEAMSKKCNTKNEFLTYSINKDDDNNFIQSSNFEETLTVLPNTFAMFNNSKPIEKEKSPGKDFGEGRDMNIVFVSESQEHRVDNSILPDRYTPEACKAVIQTEALQSRDNKEITQNFFHENFSLESFLCDRNIYTITQQNYVLDGNNNQENISHHFEVSVNKIKTNENQSQQLHTSIMIPDTAKLSKAQNIRFNFNFKNRLRFVPKGLSPIFANCKTKEVCNYILDKDYYANDIYQNFVNEVQVNADIFEPNTENVKELHTKAIDKVTKNVNKDHRTLIFSGDSLRNATVLNQVDQKFIAAKMFSKDDDITQHLVLFDQHAVDERIRLEKCLEQYVNHNKWKSHTLDEVIVMNLVQDEIIYLYNYKDKFCQLGLKWSTSDNVITISAIPEAVLGKHCRPVEIVIRAVKDLILEQLNSIKSQNGCLTLYPKSLMDLIFSEACRYAIKFGDKLSRDQCVELLANLAECKTPFQCAHGRPVMAVLVDLKDQKDEYTVDLSKLELFMKQRQMQFKKLRV